MQVACLLMGELAKFSQSKLMWIKGMEGVGQSYRLRMRNEVIRMARYFMLCAESLDISISNLKTYNIVHL